MAKPTKKLSPLGAKALIKPGRHSDGDGLYLVVEKSGSKRWAFIFRWREPGKPAPGRLREMGLGSFKSVTLAKARDRAAEAREHLADGKDPIAEAKADRAIPTFGEAADALVRDLTPQWRNDKHIAQWTMTLTEYAANLRPKPIDTITTEDVLAALKPVWTTKPETAARLRGRIERVLDAAKANGHRSGENPARWRGHLDHLLPKRQRLSRGHHTALPYPELPDFMTSLRGREGTAALALEFLILTAARSGEVLGATWSEIDLSAKTWTVPPERMKAAKEHRVPLSEAALAVLTKAGELRKADHVFPGQSKKTGKLSVMALEMVLRRMKVGVTVHGFRSTFRDWAGEETSFPREVAEAALAHTIGDEVERAYRRGDALEKRRKLMDAWASFVDTGQADNVIVLAGAKK